MTAQADAQVRTVIYRLHVIAGDAAELAANAGGLIVDRMMSGWRVSVQLLRDAASGPNRSVQILGAELVDDVQAPILREGEQCVLVMGADSYHRMTSAGQRFPAGWAEVLVWGESPDPAHIFGHNLSSAARAFKALAVGGADLSGEAVAIAETFTSFVDSAVRA
ncbi:hypothetical protein A5721_14000 [Mycobacterium vulneris]|nr:hypothetical protein A5721_14000 [Mycolicibacterium vulneris]